MIAPRDPTPSTVETVLVLFWAALGVALPLALLLFWAHR